MSPQRGGRERWTAADIPDQQGRTAVVTGANTGLGLETAKALAERGAAVVLACRDTAKADAAAARVRAAAPAADVRVIRLDLASLASVREAAARVRADAPRLDLLINNAGVMMPPYGLTDDGFEQQFGINHLGHFAFTGLVLASLLAVPGSRVVTVSSTAHRAGRINFDNLDFHRNYRRISAYGQSKLANLMFTYELQRRLAAADAATIALAAHPGTARTELGRHIPAPLMALSRIMASQSAAQGALPLLRAATDPDARGGAYYGPGGFQQAVGYPVRVRSTPRSHDVAVQRRLWEVSEELTGVTFDIPGTAAAPTA